MCVRARVCIRRCRKGVRVVVMCEGDRLDGLSFFVSSATSENGKPFRAAPQSRSGAQIEV